MPGAEAVYSDEDEEDLYPQDEEAHQTLVTSINEAWQAADLARSPFHDRWMRYYKAYRSYVVRKKGDWRSKVFVPVSFHIVETITPRLVAQLPRMLALPVSEDDVEPAKVMEESLSYCADRSNLYLPLVLGYKSALKYGTGILKTFYDEQIRYRRERTPVMQTVETSREEPVIDPETGLPMRDPDGNMGIDTIPESFQEPVLDPETGEPMTETNRVPYAAYEGPAAEWIDIFNFWPAPEATTIDDARYVIQSVIRDETYLRKKIADHTYQLPPWMGMERLFGSAERDPASERLAAVGLSGGGRSDSDPTRKAIEIWEFWTDDMLITVANRSVILCVKHNPFDHGQKPYIRIVDHLVEGEFWGIGEIEPIEGQQDLINVLTNQRVDNVKLVMNAMFAVNESALESLDDLKPRPGGVIRIKSENLAVDQAIKRIDFGDVTSSAFEEVQQTKDTIEQASGVSAYQTGTDSPSLNKTATGISIIQEQGATRFGLKVKLAELTGLTRLAQQFGSIIQQFWGPEKVLRLVGERGQYLFKPLGPEALLAGLDYDIEAQSSVQTESMRRDQSMSLLNLLAGLLPPQIDPMTGQPMPGSGVMALIEDVLVSFGHKDTARYLGGPQAEMPGAGPEAPQDPLAALGGMDQLPPGELQPAAGGRA